MQTFPKHAQDDPLHHTLHRVGSRAAWGCRILIIEHTGESRSLKYVFYSPYFSIVYLSWVSCGSSIARFLLRSITCLLKDSGYSTGAWREVVWVPSEGRSRLQRSQTGPRVKQTTLEALLFRWERGYPAWH